MTVSAPRILATAAAVLLLAGCAPSYDIDALADEMRPVVTEIVRLTYQDEVPDDAYFTGTTNWCGNPPRPEDRGKHRYYEHIPRRGLEEWGANGYTVQTLTEAVRDRLVLPGWETTEIDETEESPMYAEGFMSTTFESVPEGGGALIRIRVYGAPGGSLSLNVLAMTACVTAPVD